MSNNTSSKIAVSVIIPVTENKNYLARCLESILSQSLRNIEIILVDISSDSPSSLCAKYANQDGRIKSINKNGVGYGAAFNAGLADATGEYIAFVDFCDWLETEMFEVLYEIASDHDVDVVHCLKYSNKDGAKTKAANAFANTVRHHVNIRSDYKFYVPMMLFYSEDMYSSIYRKDFLTDNEIKFSEIPGSNAQNLGFTFLVFCNLGSFYIHEAPLYHLNPKRSYFTNKSFSTAMQSVGEYDYIKKLIEQRGLKDKYIGKRYLHIAMAKIFRHIRHRYLAHCKTVGQKMEFLKSVEPLLKDYYPLKNDNMFLNYREKRLYKRLLRHPLKTSITYSLNKEVMRLSKKLLTDISFHSNHKQIRIFGFRFFFYKRTADYYTFNLCYLPIIRQRKYKNIEENSNTTNYYFLGLMYAKDVWINDWRRSAWILNRKNYNWINNSLTAGSQLFLDKRISDLHIKAFPIFKDSNTGGSIKIFGNGMIYDDAIHSYEGKIIACNKNIKIFEKKPEYIFASEYIVSNDYFDYLILNQKNAIFFDCANMNSIMMAKRARHLGNMNNIIFYYGNWRFYDEISQEIENSPLAFFGDIVHSAIHFALYTNPDVIYLIGCDIYDEGVRKNNRKFAPTKEELIIGYKKIKTFKDSYYPKTKIVCVNPHGINGIFDEQYTDDFLKSSQKSNM